jgi:anaerobic selenocysteine-containing dehydrogenase
LARVVDGRVVKLEGNPAHPMNQGKPCPRAQAGLQVLYDPDRLQGPLRRVGERGEDQWQEISWDEALAELVDRLQSLQGDDHPDRLLFLHNAPPGTMRDLINRFGQGFGTPNVVTGDEWDAERLTHQLTQGWFDLAAHNWEQTTYVLFFGNSFLEDWQPQVHMLRSYPYIRRGRPDRRGRLVQIGSRLSVSAIKADEWVPLLPGREGALALGMAHVIIRERLYDSDYIENQTEGFDETADLILQRYSPDEVAGLTGVPPDTIKRLAREFSGNDAAVAVSGRGLTSATNEVYTRVAVHLLNALVGNIDLPGGTLRPQAVPFTPWDPPTPNNPPGIRFDGAGGSQLSLAGGAYAALGQRLRCGPYRPEVLLLHEVNPLHQALGAPYWRDAFRCIPFIASFSPFMDESTRQADLVLPNHSYLERWIDGIPPGGTGLATVGIGAPVVEPLYDTRHTGDVLLTLAQALGGEMANLFPWQDFESLLRFRAEGLHQAWGSIKTDSFDQFWSELVDTGVWYGDPYVFRGDEEPLATPSGRFRFRLEGLQDILREGADAVALGIAATGPVLELPHYESPLYAGDPNEFPLHLVPYRVVADAGCRAPNAPLLWELYGLHLKERWHSWVEINPETGHHLGIDDGDQVWVESPLGRIQLKARLYEGAMPDVVSIPMGGGHTAGGRWARQVGGGNVADIVVPQTDPLAGSAAWAGTRVRVAKVESGS